MLKLIRYTILFLIFLNFPEWILANFSPIYSSILSYLSFGLMMVYFLFSNNKRLNLWMILLGVLYFGIGTLSNPVYLPDNVPYLIIIIKFFIIIICGFEVIKDTTKNELFLFLILGAASVFLEMFVFYNRLEDYGRYSGFYINPNSLGFICMMGYGLTFSLSKKFRTFGQILFTIIGFLTFSRTFLVVWLLMNLLSLLVNIKNIRVLVIGLSLFIGLLTYNSFLPKKNVRLEAMSRIFEGSTNNTNKLQEDSRSQTWSMYYPALLSKPFFGNGYNAFEGGGIAGSVGVHNTYLKIMGKQG